MTPIQSDRVVDVRWGEVKTYKSPTEGWDCWAVVVIMRGPNHVQAAEASHRGDVFEGLA